MKTFGTHLRAIRLGFHESTWCGGYVRINAGGPPWVVDFCPWGVNAGIGGKNEHVVWWEGDGQELLNSTFQRVFEAAPRNCVTTAVLDDEGNEVREVADGV